MHPARALQLQPQLPTTRGFGSGHRVSARQVPTGCPSPWPRWSPCTTPAHAQAAAIAPRTHQAFCTRHRRLCPHTLQGTGRPNTLLQVLTTRLEPAGDKQTVDIRLLSSCICQASTGSTKNDLLGLPLHPSYICCVSIPW